MKIAVMLDSNSGMTKEMGERLGIYLVPMPFMIDGVEYLEGDTLSQDQFYEKQEQDSEISTSQPSPDSLFSAWDQALETHDQVVYIPMSSGLSSSYQSAKALSAEYEGRVQVVDNHRISVTQLQSALDAKKLAAEGLDAVQILQKLEAEALEATIYIMVDTLKYLKRGGRITPAAAALGTLLRLKPVLSIQGEKLDAYAKARTLKQAKSMMISALRHDLETRWEDQTGEKMNLYIAHTQNEEAARIFQEELRESFPGMEFQIAALSLNIACHLGPGSLAIAASRRL